MPHPGNASNEPQIKAAMEARLEELLREACVVGWFMFVLDELAGIGILPKHVLESALTDELPFHWKAMTPHGQFDR
ncbi:hypothetical protein [Rhodopirellula sp. P2]|uniref:hypothetical protein n=1 Tax=Rhodopirellula sp. P2 TaxID=2127060 RepID=UPI002367A00A|nr:hypothetical protein [Rhodopirellula sp. P2]WDQ15688.1 hypothetical protein PSR62_18845 [Rhodopirellula sp. P2]